MNSFATLTDLMPHQKNAVAKLLPTRVGALFAEMGTGKSRMAIELAKIRSHKIDRVLWFCPVSLKETVRREILKHTDCEDIYVFKQSTDEVTIDMTVRWYVIGLESISQSTKAALTTRGLITENTFVIVDESTYIKGHRALRTQRLIAFCQECRYRMILTGTPMTQGVPDLFSQMYFLSDKILGYKSWYSFAANHLEYHPRKRGLIVATHNHEFLAAKMKPYVYQITKGECLTLPDKLYETYFVDLTNDQREAYARAKDDFEQNIIRNSEDEIDPISIFHLFTSLQSIVCGFWNYNENWAWRGRQRIMKNEEYDHGRIDCLLDTIAKIHGDEKIIIWSKYRYCLNQITEALQREYGEDSTVRFYGDRSPKQREAELARFRADARFFIATQSCGGHGLTLNEAHHVIFYADGFKYSERNQAEDRCHRIGQTNPVTYVTIRADAGIDDRIADSLHKKSNALDDFRSEINKIKSNGIKDKVRELISKL